MFFETSTPPQANRTYLSISEDGQKQTVYELPKDTLQDKHNTLFYAAENGSFDVLSKEPEGSLQLFSFNEDGQLSSLHTLDTPKDVIPESFAVNSEGDLLLLAYHSSSDQSSDTGGGKEGLTYRVIFNSSGSLLSTLPVSHKKVNDSGIVEDASRTLVRANGTQFFWLSGDVLQLANERGDVIQSIKITPPTENSFVGGLMISGNIAEITFRTPSTKRTLNSSYLLLNLNDGEPYGTYVAPEGSPMQLGCFDSKEGFTFLSYKDKRLSLVTATLP